MSMAKNEVEKPKLGIAQRLPKKERGAEATKARIVVSAITEFSAKGFDGARLSAIARAAEVQAALIHHYFVDKEGLFRAALQHGLEPMSTEVWSVLGAFEGHLESARKDKRRLSLTELRFMVMGFVTLVEHLFTSHGSLLGMLRHEAERDGVAVRDTIGQLLGPLFDACAKHLEEMQRRKELNPGFDVRQLCMFVIGMVGFFQTDRTLVGAMWPVDHDSEAARSARRDELVEIIVSRVAPPA